jgi:hypothetical protein
MAKITIPPNTGKVRVAMTLGHKYTVWNGKQGKDEFSLVCRNRKEAEAIAAKINGTKKQQKAEVVIEVD